MERLKAVLRAFIASTRPRPRPLPLLLAGRPGPLPRPLTLFFVAAGISSHDTPWSLTFLLKAERDSEDSGVGGGGVIETTLDGVDGETSEEVLRVETSERPRDLVRPRDRRDLGVAGDSGVGGGGVTLTLDLFAGVDGETSGEVLRVLF